MPDLDEGDGVQRAIRAALDLGLAIATRIRPGSDDASRRLATFTASPHRSYANLFVPMTPATTGPQWTPIRIRHPGPAASTAATPVAAAVGDALAFEPRGTIELKGKGPTPTCFVIGRSGQRG